jgi:hypothetical protein
VCELDPSLVQEIQNDNQGWGPVHLVDEVQFYAEKQTPTQPEIDQLGERNPDNLIVDSIRASGGNLKLTMDIFARLPSGRGQVLRVLIDTGAEANLVKEGLLPKGEFTQAEKRLHFTTANGQPLRGGDTIVNVDLLFRKPMGPWGNLVSMLLALSFTRPT